MFLLEIFWHGCFLLKFQNNIYFNFKTGGLEFHIPSKQTNSVIFYFTSIYTSINAKLF